MTDKYSPCPCGSGLKYKFCCLQKLDASAVPATGGVRCYITPDWRDEGLGHVAVVRPAAMGGYNVAVLLVDVYCLGLKGAFVASSLTGPAVRALLDRFHAPPIEISYETVRSIVLGAIEYARRLGFKPHPDWARCSVMLESGRPFERNQEFGREGKPFFVSGLHDDVPAIMKQLDPLIRAGQADFLIVNESLSSVER